MSLSAATARCVFVVGERSPPVTQPASRWLDHTFAQICGVEPNAEGKAVTVDPGIEPTANDDRVAGHEDKLELAFGAVAWASCSLAEAKVREVYR
eukprot:420141-Prymnesium_polylepis.3